MNKLKGLTLFFSALITLSCFANVVNIENIEQFENIIRDKEYVAVKFHAPWCPACVAIGPMFKEITDMEEFSQITFLEVNIDTNYDLSKEYKIRSIPALLFFKNNKKIKTRFSYANESTFQIELIRKLNELFPTNE